MATAPEIVQSFTASRIVVLVLLLFYYTLVVPNGFRNNCERRFSFYVVFFVFFSVMPSYRYLSWLLFIYLRHLSNDLSQLTLGYLCGVNEDFSLEEKAREGNNAF